MAAARALHLMDGRPVCHSTSLVGYCQAEYKYKCVQASGEGSERAGCCSRIRCPSRNDGSHGHVTFPPRVMKEEDVHKARCERLRAVRAQERTISARKSSRYQVLLQETIDAIQRKQDQEWSNTRDILLQQLQDRAAQLNTSLGAAHERAHEHAQATKSRQESRQAKHQQTMDKINQRHKGLVKQIRVARKQSESAKKDTLKRRQAIFRADRQKAQQMTEGFRRASHETSRREAQAEHQMKEQQATVPCTRTRQRCGRAEAAGYTVQRHFNQGADGKGASVGEVCAAERNTNRERQDAAMAAQQQSSADAQRRHRRALAEVQAEAARPHIEADLHKLQVQQTAERLSKLAQGATVRRGNAQGAFENTFGAPTHRTQAALPTPVRQRKQAAAVHTPVQRPLRHGDNPKTQSSPSVWQPVSAGLPRPDSFPAATLEKALERTFFRAVPEQAPTSPKHRECAPVGGKSIRGECAADEGLPAGFFERAPARSSTETPSNGDVRQEMQLLTAQLGLVRHFLESCPSLWQ